jgi:hypothetical protein
VQSQLENACRIIEDSENRIKTLEKELETAIAVARQHEIEFQERTEWALRLDEARRENEEELLRRTVWGRKLEAELAKRTEWALRLYGELKERTDCDAPASQGEREQEGRILEYLRHALRIVDRLLGSHAGRVRKLLG